MMEQTTTEIKRKLIKAIFSGNMTQAKELQRKLLFAEEMPLFIQYKVKNGKVYIDWKDMVLSVQEFEQLKKDCPQVVCWQEEKEHSVTIATTEKIHSNVRSDKESAERHADVKSSSYKEDIESSRRREDKPKKKKPQKIEPDVKEETPAKKPEKQPAPQKDHWMGRAEMEFIAESNEILHSNFPWFT